MNEEKPLTREELRKLRPPMRHLYISQKEQLTGTEKFATWVTERIGTMGFFYILIGWTILWMLWNLLAPESLQFDSVPTFFFWIFISNMMQLFFLPLIMVGQNLQGVHQDARAQADFELNQIAEREIDTVLIHLEKQNQLIVEILNRLEGEMKEDIALDKRDIAIDQEIKNELKNVL